LVVAKAVYSVASRNPSVHPIVEYRDEFSAPVLVVSPVAAANTEFADSLVYAHFVNRSIS
jgi:hypothetical protein